ncbi:MAG: hypothetical protein ACI4QN_01610 [Candidatus Coproplasma sp.]
MEDNKLSQQELAIEELIQSSENCIEEQSTPVTVKEEAQTAECTQTEDENKIFKKYKIKDIVFLAIITACTLVTGAIMPLLVNVPLFGIIQLGLGLQFSLFPVIGMMKVKKPGALLLQSVFISIFLVFMFPPMVLLIACALVAEALTLLIFRGYKNDWACVFAGTLYMPLTIPFLYMYYNLFYTVSGSEKAAVSMFIGGGNAGVVIGITIAVVALCFVGSLVGMIIARELKKAGKLK